MSLPRILTIMGSGETAPTMVSTHRALVAQLPSPARALLLDTPYGFQENAPELAARAVAYFRTSVNIDITVAGLVRMHDTHLPADPVLIERGLRALTDSHYIFAGPGSPTYALRQWSGTNVASIIENKIRHGGIVTFASAAALTLGRVTLPVYEIYKVGQDVERLDGLDLLSALDINAAVIPHYDNAEGGNHDTRFCYLGETRLHLFESLLDDDTYVLGVDEHTGLIIDSDAGTARVVGNGTVTIRLRSVSHTLHSGATMDIEVLQNPWKHFGTTTATPATTSSLRTTETVAAADSADASDDTFEGTLTRLNQDFGEAIAARDADSAVRACLDLEQAIVDWSSDTLQGDVADRARAAVRSMISQLGDASSGGLKDPREVVGPYVEAMLAVRATVRTEKRFDLSDVIRDAFANLGVEVRDTPAGVEWVLNSTQ
jgi:hypothetical protein